MANDGLNGFHPSLYPFVFPAQAVLKQQDIEEKPEFEGWGGGRGGGGIVFHIYGGSRPVEIPSFPPHPPITRGE